MSGQTNGAAAIRCDRCGRRWRRTGEWNVETRQGRILGYLCPTCQTPAENIEAAVNDATLHYGHRPDGRLIARPRLDGLDD